MTHGGAHDTARTCVDGTTGARTTRSAALGRHDGFSRPGARSASPVLALLEPSRQCEEEESRTRGDVTRRTAAHTTLRARASAKYPAHARRGQRRSAVTTTRSRIGARLASPVSALLEPSRRCDEESAWRGDGTRRTAAHTRRARGTVMSLDPRRRTRHGAHMRQQNNQRTHDMVNGAR